MKPIHFFAAIGALAVGTGATAALARPSREALMDEIERQVRLPFGAAPLEEYGRYYFFEGKGRVKAIYRHWSEPAAPPPPRPGSRCEAIVEGKRVMFEGDCPPRPDDGRFLRGGQRRWVADRRAVPTVFDGGCATVHVTFDLKTRRIERIGCSGIA